MKKTEILLLILVFISIPFFVFSQLSLQEGLNISAVVSGTGTIPTPPTPPGGGGSYYVSPKTKIIFEGKAYPSANITILKNNTVSATFRAESSGFFKRELTGLMGGNYTFSVFAEDTEGRISESIIFSFDILNDRTTTFSGIFIPPTMSINPRYVTRGEEIKISGQTYPNSQLQIFISPVNLTEKISSSFEGKWLLNLKTSSLREGEYSVKSKAFWNDLEQSPFSKDIYFFINPETLNCQKADFNDDGIIDVVDFSILMHFWEQISPSEVRADINFNGIVDIFDFSILMYCWEK